MSTHQCDYVYGPDDTTDHVFETLGSYHYSDTTQTLHTYTLHYALKFLNTIFFNTTHCSLQHPPPKKRTPHTHYTHLIPLLL